MNSSSVTGCTLSRADAQQHHVREHLVATDPRQRDEVRQLRDKA